MTRYPGSDSDQAPDVEPIALEAIEPYDEWAEQQDEVTE